MRRALFVSAILFLTTCSNSDRDIETDTSEDIDVALGRVPRESALHLAVPSGATSLIVEATLGRGDVAEIVVAQHQGDLMLVHVMTPDEDLELAVHRMDTGEQLPDDDDNPSFWKGHLPATLGYLVEIGGASTETPYSLEIEIPRRLHFDEATSTATVTSEARPEAPIAYLIDGAQGQTLTAELTLPGAHMTVHGIDDGHALLTSSGDATIFADELHESQAYILRIHPNTAGGEFTLEVSLEEGE